MNPEFLSGEASASPAVEALLAGARRLAKLGFGGGALSARNGPRVTTHAAIPFELLSDQEFVEVADYDPHLDRLMVLGSRSPHPYAGLHALVFRAKKEIGALVQIETPQPAGRGGVGVVPQNDAEKPRPAGRGDVHEAKRGRTTLENALALLEALRGRDAARLGPHLFVTGRTVPEAMKRAEELLG